MKTIALFTLLIIGQMSFAQKAAMKSLIGKKGHVATRNFPESVAELRKKWKIADGGTNYWFFVTLEKGEKVVLETSKIGD